MDEQPNPNTSSAAPVAAAGWYTDPATGQLRWWDGAKWTDQIAPSTPTRRTSGLAIAGFLIGILAFLGFATGVGAAFAGLVGVIFSGMGISDARQNNKAGQGLAVAGLILSILGGLAGVGVFAINFGR